MTTAAAARNPLRDSSEELVTRVYKRPPPFSLDRAMVQRILSDLGPGAAARPIVVVRRPPPPLPNVFLTPCPEDLARLPWGVIGVEDVELDEDVKPAPRVVRRRSLMPWAAFLMTFSITFGVAKDPVLRHQTASQIKAAASATQSSAMRLWSFVSRIRT